MDRRSFLRLGGAMGGVVALPSVLAGCSSPVGGNEAGSPTKTVPSAAFVQNKAAGSASPLPDRLGISIVQAEGPIGLFAGAISDAAEAAGLDTLEAISKGNASTGVTQVNEFLQRGVGAMFVQDFDPPSQEAVIMQAMDQDVAVFTFNMTATCQITADQYTLGKTMAEGTLQWIRENLNDQAEVVHFNASWLPSVKARDDGYADVMKQRPSGVEIVADIPSNPETQQYGSEAMGSILQRHPDVNVVDGNDTVLLGCLAALEAAGRASDPDVALIGMDGDPQAIDALVAGSAFKAVYAFAYPVLGSLVGALAGNWMKGLNIPQVVMVPAVKLHDNASVSEYRAANADPMNAYVEGNGTYYEMLGSISYDTRGSYFSGDVR